MSRRTAATHLDAGTAKLMAHRGRRDAQLGTDLPHSLALGGQVGRTLDLHRTVIRSNDPDCLAFRHQAQCLLSRPADVPVWIL